ncbi:MAG: carbohydrate ABC transporter substrate-binding protein [Spirochaetes bacterium]|nr:MAG: carbohydrate ABC transporter substrate-binding protein [Spirochaetota bacterium]
MKSFKSIGMVLILLLVSAFLFAGGKAETEKAESAEKITLTMLEYQDVTDESEVGTWKVLLETFYEENPNVELKIDTLFDEAYHNKLQAMLVADQLPDIMFLWPGKRTGQITSSGKIKDLRPWLKGYENDFADIAIAPQGPNGEIWELPEQVTATHVMYTNERLLNELGLTYPKTLDELIGQGKKIRDAGYIPIAMDNGGGWQMQSCLLSALVERTGGMDWLERAMIGKAKFTDPEFVNSLEVIDVLAKNQMFSPGINQAQYGQALTDFVNEKAVYFIDGGWRVTSLVSELAEEQKSYVKLNVFPEVPNTRGQRGSTAAVAGTGYGMHAKLEGAKAEAAWKWIWHYSGPVGSKIRQAEGAVPAYNLEVPADTDILVKRLTEFTSNVPAGYVLDAKLSQEGMGVLQPALQEMIFGNKTPQQVAQEYENWVAKNEPTRK